MKLRNSIVKVLAYFDLFNYPVSFEEIQFFLDRKASENDLQADLSELTNLECIFKFDKFYSLRRDPSLVKKRIKENIHAQHLLITAHKISKFLFKFPFVKGIGISGSLSKNVANEKSDMDYFIITQSDKLWIARTIMHFFKKLTFLTGHQHWYCMNYYVDEKSLQIEEKNIFTATELATLMPICGNDTMEKFFEANNWTGSYFPNYIVKDTVYTNKSSQPFFKKIIESLFNNSLGNRLDNFLMNLTTRRWKEKENKHKLNMRGIRMGLKTNKHYCKPNPSFFHEKVLASHANKVNEYEKKWDELLIEQSILSS